MSGSGQAYQVNLSWDAPDPGLDAPVGYFIYRANSGANYSLLNSSATLDTTFQDAAVVSGTYTYYVTSVDANGYQSAPSNQLIVAVP